MRALPRPPAYRKRQRPGTTQQVAREAAPDPPEFPPGKCSMRGSRILLLNDQLLDWIRTSERSVREELGCQGRVEHADDAELQRVAVLQCDRMQQAGLEL